MIEGMHLERPDALLLDAGNTLVFLDHEALSEVARRDGFDVAASLLALAEPEAKRRYENGMTAGMSHEDGWELYVRVMFEEAGAPAPTASALAQSARRAHDVFNLWRKVPAGLPEALSLARAAGIRLGIVSNSEGKLAELLRRLSLESFFEVVVDSALVGVRKPDPRIFRIALERMGLPAERATYAGDIPHVDVDGARRAGMQAVLVDALDHYPSYTDAPRFHSIAELIDELLRP